MTEIKINTEELVKPDYKRAGEIPTFQILPESALQLREAIPTFDFTNPPINPNSFASSLTETCKQNKGFGLSANQCGYKHRVFVMGTGDDFVAHFNPEVVGISSEAVHMMEGCLSFPFLGLMITRPAGVKVKYQDFVGEWHEATYTGLSARVFLHELDHLDGIVFTQRVKPLALQSGIKKRGKMIKNLSRQFIMKSEPNGNSKRRNRKTVARVD